MLVKTQFKHIGQFVQMPVSSSMLTVTPTPQAAIPLEPVHPTGHVGGRLLGDRRGEGRKFHIEPRAVELSCRKCSSGSVCMLRRLPS